MNSLQNDIDFFFWNTIREALGATPIGDPLEDSDTSEITPLVVAPPDVRGMLPTGLAKWLSEHAYRLGSTLEVLLVVFLSVFASLFPASTRLQVGPNFTLSPNTWVVLVGLSGTKKSPLLEVFLALLKPLHTERFNRFKEEKKEYKAKYIKFSKGEITQEELGNEPTERVYFETDFTMESLLELAARQGDSGVLLYMDELMQLFNQTERYRKGSDRQQLLQLAQGGHVSVSRSTKERAYTPYTNVNITGGIQPEVLKSFQGNACSVDDGLLYRFAFVLISLCASPAPSKWNLLPQEEQQNLERVVKAADDYKHAEGTYFEFAENAQLLVDQWFEENEVKGANEDDPLRGVYPKAKDRAYRHALLLHLLHELWQGNASPSLTIPIERLQDAITLNRWLISQTLTVLTQSGFRTDPGIAAQAYRLQRLQAKGWLRPSDYAKTFSSAKRPTTDQAAIEMAELVKQGLAEDNGHKPSNREYRIQIISSQKSGNLGNLVHMGNVDSHSVPKLTLVPDPVAAKQDADCCNREQASHSGTLLTNQPINLSISDQTLTTGDAITSNPPNIGKCNNVSFVPDPDNQVVAKASKGDKGLHELSEAKNSTTTPSEARETLYRRGDIVYLVSKNHCEARFLIPTSDGEAWVQTTQGCERLKVPLSELTLSVF